MRKLYILLTLLLIAELGMAQQWQWAAKPDYVSQQQYTRGLCIDQQNNVYVAGFNVGASTIYGNTTLSAGPFLVKYSSQGTVLWAMNLPNAASTIACDADNNIYVLGWFNYMLNYNGNIPSNGGSDIYLAKLDGQGQFLSMQTFGGTGNELPVALHISSAGNIYISGTYENTVQFGSHSITADPSKTCSFLVKEDAQGNVAWALSKDQYCMQKIRSITTDPQEKVYTRSEVMECNDFSQAQVERLSASGLAEATATIGAYESFDGIGIDAAGNVYTIYNGGGHYSNDPVLVKYDNDLNLLWHKPTGGYGGHHFGESLIVKQNGDVYLAGGLGSTMINSDHILIDGDEYYFYGEGDAAVAALDAAGNYKWIETIKGKGGEFVTNIALNNAGQLYAAGLFNWGGTTDTMWFDNTVMVSSSTPQQIFVAGMELPEEPLSAGNLIDTKESFYIYPNPSNGKFVLYTSALDNTEPVISIYDARGRSVTVNTRMIPGGIHIELQERSKGLYFIELQQGDKRETKKVMIE
jgi:hypothetical protein